jgi:hypothetical protein
LNKCRWINQSDAIRSFATHQGATQGQEHIKPLHWYVACRLVLEGGFLPEEVTPHPPFRSQRRGSHWLLDFDESVASGGEATILGGLKTKNVDVVVAKDGLGPVLAVSCKGMTGAFRNLTNRMEETIGECTNLHITYPAMVFGYLFVIRANRQAEVLLADIPTESNAAQLLKANDVAIQAGGEPVESILRFHSALRELTGRRGIRDDVSRYEAVALALADMREGDAGEVLSDFPPADSPLRMNDFFASLYHRYDERFVYSAPDLKSKTARVQWASTSPLLHIRNPLFSDRIVGYELRLDG